MTLIKSFLSATFVVTLMTCLLYVSGSSYLAGYLLTLGIEEGILRHEFVQTLEKGGLVFMLGWIKISILGVMSSFAALLYAYLAHEISKEDWIKRIANSIKRFFTKKRSEEMKEASFLFKKLLKVTALLFLSWVLVALMAYFYFQFIKFSSDQGEVQAIEKLNKISRGDHYHEYQIADSAKRELKGFIVAADEKTLVVYVVPRSERQSATLELLDRSNVIFMHKTVELPK